MEFQARKQMPFHNINNKLAIILGTCELLSLRTTDPEDLACLRAIEEAAQAIVDEVNRVTMTVDPGKSA